jgi:ATP-dependent RNA helicase DOB1
LREGIGDATRRFVLSFSGANEDLKTSLSATSDRASQNLDFQSCVINTDALLAISSVKIFIPKVAEHKERQNKINAHLLQVLARFPDGPPLLDPISDMGFNDKQTKELTEVSYAITTAHTNLSQKIELLEAKLVAHHLHRSENVFEYYAKFSEKAQLLDQIKTIKREIVQLRSANNGDSLKFRRRFLRRLGYLDEHDVVTLKGRVACEISCADEILLSELLFSHFFQPYNPAQCAALLSCFVSEESSVSPRENPLADAITIMNNQAKEVTRVAKESKLNLTEVILKGSLVAPVLSWAEGQSFSSVW